MHFIMMQSMVHVLATLLILFCQYLLIFTELPAAPSLKRGSNAGMVVGIVLVLALAALIVVFVTIGIVV